MPALQINDNFANRYLLKKLIGIGGYSQVWLAEDRKSGNLEVALKIFAPEKGLDSIGLEVFSKEYSLVFNLNHKNLLIPKHFDDFEGSPYLVMQYCRQGSVFLKIGEISEKELARFMHQSASALSYLHQQYPPIIHQDIKPDNFLIDNQGNYLLADFGISNKIRRTLTKSIGTQASTGTLAYMPPEKFSADKQIIKAGDIFSLGVTMYELLTGILPFGDHGGMVMLTGAQVPNLPPAFNPELNSLLKSCMSKDPWDRPPAEKLAELVSEFLNTGNWPVVGIATPNPTPPPAPDTKNTYWIIALVLVIGILAIILTKGPSEKEIIEVARQDSLRLADSLSGITVPKVPEKIDVEGGINLEFVKCIVANNTDKKLSKKGTLSNFYIGKYEVTQKQWQDVMGNDPSYFSVCDNCPVEQVSWNDVQAFIRKLNQKTGNTYRLPTEAEWEYAAKGGNKIDGFTYSGSNNLSEVAWHFDNSILKTHPVGQLQPNELGLYDMSGNVWEWCADMDGANSPGSKTHAGGHLSPSSRVFRGGSWYYGAEYCLSANRYSSISPDGRFSDLGFRLVVVP